MGFLLVAPAALLRRPVDGLALLRSVGDVAKRGYQI